MSRTRCRHPPSVTRNDTSQLPNAHRTTDAPCSTSGGPSRAARGTSSSPAPASTVSAAAPPEHPYDGHSSPAGQVLVGLARRRARRALAPVLARLADTRAI